MNRKDLRSPLQGGLQVFFCIRIKRTGSSLPFQKIFHTAARRSAQAKKGLCRRPADIVLPLLKKPDLTDGHAGFFGESGLRESRELSPHAESGPGKVFFHHLIHFVTDGIHGNDPFQRYCGKAFPERTAAVPLVKCQSPAGPVFRTFVRIHDIFRFCKGDAGFCQYPACELPAVHPRCAAGIAVTRLTCCI